MPKNKTIMRGNSSQSGAVVHQKTMGHVTAVLDDVLKGSSLRGGVGKVATKMKIERLAAGSKRGIKGSGY